VNLLAEEPDALIGLVRFCGGFGGAIPRFYPESKYGKIIADEPEI
jgi:hypothetical protein